jgi:hypothetical protein
MRRIVVLVLTAMLGLGAVPASAGSDTTPPTLVSFSVSPTQVDASAGEQTISVTAEITDDLSGLCAPTECPIGYVGLGSPSGEQGGQGGGYLQPVSGNTYTATFTIAQFAEQGVWARWTIYIIDRVGNDVVIDEKQLLVKGINVAVGVGNYASTYDRSLTFRLSPRSAPHSVFGSFTKDEESPCSLDVPLIVQRKTRSGWKQVGKMYSSDGRFRLRWEKDTPGKYRVIAPTFGIGTPTLTTCLKTSAVESST